MPEVVELTREGRRSATPPLRLKLVSVTSLRLKLPRSLSRPATLGGTTRLCKRVERRGCVVSSLHC